MVVRRSLASAACALALGSPGLASAALQVVIVEGLGGEELYTHQFDAEVEALHKASAALTDYGHIRVFQGAAARRADVLGYFRTLAGQLQAEDRVLVYLIGHGSFDGLEYKFNIPGPDLTGHDIAGALNALPAEQQVLIATGSSSGALQELLGKPTRVVITGTRSGNEKNATHFGEAFVAAFTDPSADLDKNGAISAREAFDFAARRVKDQFEHETQLATEHPTLAGERAARFTLAQLVPAGASSAGQGQGQGQGAVPAELGHERDELNAQIEELRLRKDKLPEGDYNAQLERLLLQLAQVQERIDAASPEKAP
jgi:hypothetical protein